MEAKPFSGNIPYWITRKDEVKKARGPEEPSINFSFSPFQRVSCTFELNDRWN